jgi:hypothetical protein
MEREPTSGEAGGVQARLHQMGFSAVSERRDDAAFGDTEITFERGSTLVRLVRDRGQWFVEATARGWSGWFAPTIWRSLLIGSMPSTDAVPYEGQARRLLDDLVSIASVTDRASEHDLSQLLDWRSRRAEARRGLPPSPGTKT